MFHSHESLFKPSALQNLKFYRYSAVDKSPLTKYILRHYWDFAVTLFPMSMAPNLITLTGLGFIVFNIATLVVYVPDLVGPAPSWVYYSFAIGLFLYQTFDNVDGRQARRTRSSSALGHIFDHTIDTLNTPMSGLIQAACLGLGHSSRGVFMLLVGLWPMWLSTWEEYYTGTLYLGYINGPTEGILLACGVQITSAFFGPMVWRLPLGAFAQKYGIPAEIQLVDLLQCFVVFAVVIIHAPACIYNVYTATRGKTNPFSFVSALSQNVPFAVYNLLAACWILSPHSTLINNGNNNTGNVIEFALLITFTFGKLGPRVILARLTKSPFPWFNCGAFCPLLGGAILGNLPLFGLPLNSNSELWYLRISLVYAMLDFVIWFSLLCQHFMVTLGIGCLSIKERSD